MREETFCIGPEDVCVVCGAYVSEGEGMLCHNCRMELLEIYREDGSEING